MNERIEATDAVSYLQRAAQAAEKMTVCRLKKSKPEWAWGRFWRARRDSNSRPIAPEDSPHEE